MISVTLSLAIAIFGRLWARSFCQEFSPETQHIRDCLEEHNIRPDSVVKDMKTCFQTFIGDELLQNFTLESTPVLIKKICRDDPIKCITQAQKQVEVCLDEKFKDINSNIIKMTEAGRKFICKDDGQKIIDIIQDPNLPACLEKVAKHAQNCRKNSGKMLVIILQNGLLFTEDGCRMTDNSSNCMIDQLKIHCDASISDYFGSLNSNMLMSSPCKDYLSDSAAQLLHLPFLVMTVFAIHFYWQIQY